MTIICPVAGTSPRIAACGQTIEYPFIFEVLDAGSDPDCRYDFQLNSQDFGIPSFTPPQTGVMVTNGPTGVVDVQLFKSYQDGPFELVDECQVTVPQTEFKVFAQFPTTDVPFGSVTESMLEGWFTDTNGAASYPFGVEDLQNLAIVNGCMRVRFQPNTNNGQVGSTRTIFTGSIPDSDCYCVEQTIVIPNPMDYGGSPGQQTIKLGFGIGGGQVITGGGGYNPCGWSFRWILRGNELRGYSYAFGRPQADEFGQDIPTGVTAAPGGSYDLKMKICKNTDGNADGSYELFVNNNLQASDFNVLWMDHTQCSSQSANTMNELIHTSFYGGTNSANQQWWPDGTYTIDFCNPCYTALAA